MCSVCLDKLTGFKLFKEQCLESRSALQNELHLVIGLAMQEKLQDVRVDEDPVFNVKEESEDRLSEGNYSVPCTPDPAGISCSTLDPLTAAVSANCCARYYSTAAVVISTVDIWWATKIGMEYLSRWKHGAGWEERVWAVSPWSARGRATVGSSCTG
ncbi:uncharacterized protein LOC124169238 [Ischnura elegans]|uniref:uncharacterized protein LOC124169238 n=1 Tax=Ischnura elegans TaxID=197161 RepID=UPI001ED8B9DB|nr:uncharacterized protein LOC124169238 [Ischnura elegans]XP_046403746.1 uncharacterized protein LOC124169238 [Ischnura elegans]XP_046403747.1 uncharacterized protein LOC124169238 [Ischnura elegans]XP_046403749.1 uncharacterized protein LOC124169238 [Ischnura elegans]